MEKKSEEVAAGLSTSRSHTVEAAARDWLEHGLPGRSERTREVYRDALAPLLEEIGKRPLRDGPFQPEPRNAHRLGRVGPGKPGERRTDVRRRQVGQGLIPDLPKHGPEYIPVLRHGLRRPAGHPFAEPVLDGQAERGRATSAPGARDPHAAP